MCSSVYSVLFSNPPFLLWIHTNCNIWIATMTSYVRSVISVVQSVKNKVSAQKRIQLLVCQIAVILLPIQNKRRNVLLSHSISFVELSQDLSLYVCVYSLKDCAWFWIDEANSDQTTLDGSNFWLITFFYILLLITMFRFFSGPQRQNTGRFLQQINCQEHLVIYFQRKLVEISPLFLSFFPLSFDKKNSPWYSRNDWPGVKHQFTYLLRKT